MHVRRSLRATAADLREHRDASRPSVVAQARTRPAGTRARQRVHAGRRAHRARGTRPRPELSSAQPGGRTSSAMSARWSLSRTSWTLTRCTPIAGGTSTWSIVIGGIRRPTGNVGRSPVAGRVGRVDVAAIEHVAHRAVVERAVEVPEQEVAPRRRPPGPADRAADRATPLARSRRRRRDRVHGDDPQPAAARQRERGLEPGRHSASGAPTADSGRRAMSADPARRTCRARAPGRAAASGRRRRPGAATAAGESSTRLSTSTS